MSEEISSSAEAKLFTVDGYLEDFKDQIRSGKSTDVMKWVRPMLEHEKVFSEEALKTVAEIATKGAIDKYRLLADQSEIVPLVGIASEAQRILESRENN